MRTLFLRITSSLLAAVFICGLVVFPDVDAVLFHGLSKQQENPVHVESKGFTGCHAESCVLTTVSTETVAPGSKGPISSIVFLVAAVPVTPRSMPCSTPVGLCSPRAPPSLSV